MSRKKKNAPVRDGELHPYWPEWKKEGNGWIHSARQSRSRPEIGLKRKAYHQGEPAVDDPIADFDAWIDSWDR